MTKEEYFEKGREIWQKDVPKAGQALTIHGEMLRSIEKLRDEAHRNGNANRDAGHMIMLAYLAEILLNEDAFDTSEKARIESVLKSLDGSNIILEDEPYDYICDRIIDWHIKNKEKERRVNPVLWR